MKLYSLWLIPDEKTSQWVQGIIDNLVKDYGGVRFNPHITVLGDFEEEENVAISKLQSVARPCSPLELEFDGIRFSTTRWHEVFARIKPTIELMKLNISLKKLFNRPNDFYIPHMSFKYGNESMEMRDIISKSIKIKCTNFSIDSIALAEVGNDIEKFRIVYRIPLERI